MNKYNIELSNGYWIDGSLLNEYELSSGYISVSTMLNCRETNLVRFNNIVEIDYWYEVEPFNEDMFQSRYDAYVEDVLHEDEDEDDYNEYEYMLDHLDAFQYYIVSYDTAEHLTDFNELVFYNEELDLYIYPVGHFGTGWDYVLTNIEIVEDDKKEGTN